MTSYWTEVGGDFVLQWLLFILKIVHQTELRPQKVKEYWATNGGGRTLECKWCLLKGHHSSDGEKTVGGKQAIREQWFHGSAVLYLLVFFFSLLDMKAEAKSLVLSNKNENLPDSILRCLTQVRGLWLEI